MKKAYCCAFFLLVAAICTTISASAETFRNPVRIPTSSDPRGVFVVDLNNDGRPDILWGGYGSALTGPGVLHTLLAQASGGYVPGPTMTMPANVGSVCLPADETGDGKIDIVCPSASGFTASIYVFPGKGDGSFGTPIITAIPTLPSNGAWVSPIFHPLADLNGDGIADLMVIEAHTGSGYVMLGDGHGNFSKSSNFSGYGATQVMDINGDGKVDVVAGNIWLGKGDGTFTQTPLVIPMSAATCIFHDMDSDGKPDAVCGAAEANNGDIIGGTQLQIFHGNGDGTFGSAPIKSITYGDHSNEYNGFGTFQTPFAVLDLNGDGVLDILAEAGDGFTVIPGQSQLAFGAPVHYATGYLQLTGGLGLGGEFATQIADLNGDGLPDFVNIGPNGIYITYARKDGTLDTASAYEVTQVIGYQTLADFNEDGIPDIAATGDQSIELNLGKGDGTFQAPVALPSASIKFSTPLSATNAHILHGDFNGDHHQDIIAIGSSSIYQYDSYILFGDGTGSFSSPQLLTNSSEIYPQYDSRQVADLNQDGRDDLFSNDYGNLYASLSNGDGTFTATTTTTNSDSSQSGASSTAVLADFDHDGKLDAVWAAGPNVVISRGHGDGTFDSSALNLPIPTTLSNSWTQAAVTAGDFDGDGNQDFALLLGFQSSMYYGPAVGTQSAVYVFYGTGDGTFSSGVLAGQFNRTYTGIYAADLNKEGLADLILKTSGSLGGGYAVGIVDSLPGRAFAPEVNYYAGTGLADISIADLNHDGFADLLFSNGDYNVRANSVTVLMNQGNPPVTGTLTVDPEPSQYGQTLALNTTFVPSSFTPVTGTVAFTVDGGPATSALISSNKASIALSTPILPGTHSVTVTWPGNPIYSAVTFSAIHQVEKVPSSVTLSSSLNPSPLGGSVTLTASVSSALPVVAGADTVTFFDGQTQLGTAVSIGPGQTATYTTSGLTLGSHSITAVYSGNSLVLGSTSSALAESIPYFIGDFSIQATPSAATIAAGQSAAFQIAITATGGFVAPMAFSCSGLPALATCTFSPSTLSLGHGQVSLTVQTTGSAQSASLSPSSNLPTGGAAALLAGIVFCFLPSRARRNRFRAFFVLAVLGSVAFLATSCGGGGGASGNAPRTPAGSYQISVTAVTTEPSQNISHPVAISLTVQ
jgi:hypothetical protein